MIGRSSVAVGWHDVEDDGRDEVEGSHEDAVVMMMGATRNDVGDETGTAVDRHRRTQTPTPLRYWMQIIVDKSIGVNVAHSILPRKGTTGKGGHCHIPHEKGTPTKGGIACPYHLGTP